MKAQYVMNSAGRKTAVLLSIKEYEKILEMLEDYEDIKACHESRQRRSAGHADLVSLEDVLKKAGSV
jgi:hypothetical protein